VVLKFSSRAGSATVGGPAPRVRELRSVGDMEEFDGGLATHCDLVNGRCVDLNLMVSKTLPAVRAHVEVLRQPWSPGLESAESMLVFPIDANVEVRSGGSTQLLEPWDLALISGREDRQVYIAAQRPGHCIARNCALHRTRRGTV
jgi:environmental stress-induced protein Ves